MASPELPHLNTPTGEEHRPIIASDSLIYFNYQQPGVTQDVLTSTRPDMGSRGEHDMWISYQNPQGEWQEPLNLGDTINTSGEDMCWTFMPDGQTFTGNTGPRDSYNHDILWVQKDQVPLLKNFEPIGPPPNLFANSKKKSGNIP